MKRIQRGLVYGLGYVFPILFATLALTRIFHDSSGMNGTWVKITGDSTIPGEITIRTTNKQFKERWFDAAGVSTQIVLADGAEHLWPTNGLLKISYRAEQNRDALVITKYLQTDSLNTTSTERWVVSGNGRKLVVTGLGSDTIFERKTILASLFSGSP